MSKYKVKRYDGEDGSEVSAEDEAAMDAAGRFVESGPTETTMPRRPISRTPVAKVAPRKPASTGSGGGRGPAAGEVEAYRQQQYKAAKDAAVTPEGQAARKKQAEGDAIERVYPEQYLMPGTGIKGIAAAARNLARSGAKEAPPMVSAARGALDRAMSAERASPKTGDMAKFSDALKAAKNGPRPVSKPTASQTSFAKGPKGSLGRQSAAEREAILKGDTMDEFGAAMKRGGSVKKMASGGFTRSADGIAQRGKTRAQQFCDGGMSKGKR
jgi:hypothetical protein